MGEFFNFDSSKIFPSNDNYIFDWDEQEFPDFDILPRIHQQRVDNSFFDQNMKIDAMNEFEKTFISQKFSFNTDFSEDFYLREKKDFDMGVANSFKKLRVEVRHSDITNSIPEVNLSPIINGKDSKIIESQSELSKYNVLTTNFSTDPNSLSNPRNSICSTSYQLKNNFKTILNKNENLKANKLKKVNFRDETYDFQRKDTYDISYNKIKSFDFMKQDMIFKIEKDNNKKISLDSSTTNFLNRKSKSSGSLIDLSCISFNTNITENKDEKTTIKLIKNRIAARKSRQKKKLYIKNLEEEFEKTKDELNFYRNKCNSRKSTLDNTLQQIEDKESEILNSRDFINMSISQQIDKLYHIKNDHILLQDELFSETFKEMVKNIIPIELKNYEKKFPTLKDITNFNNLDNFLEIIIRNQSELLKLYNAQIIRKDKISLPLNLYCFFEQLKELSKKLREFHFEARKLV